MFHSASTAPSRALKYRPSRSPNHQSAVRSMLTCIVTRSAPRVPTARPAHLESVRRLQLAKARADVVHERLCNRVHVLVWHNPDRHLGLDPRGDNSRIWSTL